MWLVGWPTIRDGVGLAKPSDSTNLYERMLVLSKDVSNAKDDVINTQSDIIRLLHNMVNAKDRENEILKEMVEVYEHKECGSNKQAEKEV